MLCDGNLRYFCREAIVVANLRCFVARQFLSRIYALLSVKFSGLKMTNMIYAPASLLVAEVTKYNFTLYTE